MDTAARLIHEVGPDGLSLRRLAKEVGTSTMAVYTHFGSMDEVRRAVRREGFGRFHAYLAAVDATGDSVADLALLGSAYFLNATTNPNLYWAMFMEQPLDEADADVGAETFLRLVDGVRRCIDAGRFRPADATGLANQMWAIAHGVATLHLVGMLSADDAVRTLGDAGANLFIAFGDDPRATGRSMAAARRRLAAGEVDLAPTG